MNGVSLATNSSNRQLIISVIPLSLEKDLAVKDVEAFIKQSKYSGFYILQNALEVVCDDANAGRSQRSMDKISKTIGEIRDAAISVEIAEDHMSATLTVEAPYNGKVPTTENVISLLNQQGVVRGISRKRIEKMLNQAENSEPGEEFVEIVAIGLPSRKGKHSYVRALVPNALDRILQPQEIENGKVDMRNFGAIICVQPRQPVARLEPPSNGRKGYSVTGKSLIAQAGEVKKLRLGSNTEVSPDDPAIVISTVTGQPKFKDGVMTVDDTFESVGVNIGTGNVEYEGAVVVTGDVAESMRIVAKGDVTISGYVESAYIQSGGDIIITEGASGKMNEEDCHLIAAGSIFIQHGQGLDIIAGNNVNVKRQLAYSRIQCSGQVTVGETNKPQGSLFACSINCHSTIKAGTVGALSGSALTIDFSEGMNALIKKHDALMGMLKQVRKNTTDHHVAITALMNQELPPSLEEKLKKLELAYETEMHLQNWLEKTEKSLAAARLEYEKNARVIAYKELHPGVSVKMNKRNWRSEREYGRCRIWINNGRWEYDPIV